MVGRKKLVLVSLVIFGLSSELLLGDDDHGNSAALSTAVLIPSSTAGDIEIGDDVDWFRFSGIAGTGYKFETILGTLFDSVLALYNTDGVTQIAYDDDGGVGLASMINWTAPVNGTYYLEVGAFNPELTGTYTVNLAPTTLVPLPGAFLLGMLGLSVAGVKLRKHA